MLPGCMWTLLIHGALLDAVAEVLSPLAFRSEFQTLVASSALGDEVDAIRLRRRRATLSPRRLAVTEMVYIKTKK